MKDALSMVNELKRRYGLTDKGLAAVIGIGESSIRRWRMGHAAPLVAIHSLDAHSRLSKGQFNEACKQR